MERRERDLDLIEVILEDCATLRKRLDRFCVRGHPEPRGIAEGLCGLGARLTVASR